MKDRGWERKKKYWEGGRDKVDVKNYYKQMYFIFRIFYIVFIFWNNIE